MVPMGEWAKGRLKKLSETDKTRDESRVNSGFGKKVSNWVDRDKAYPTNLYIWPLSAIIEGILLISTKVE